MTNCLRLVVNCRSSNPEKTAVWDKHAGTTSYERLLAAGANVQQSLTDLGFCEDDVMLLALPPSADMYAVFCAVIGLGGRLMFIEPWIKPKAIAQAVNYIRPRFLVTNLLGTLWSQRIPALRSIAIQPRVSDLLRGKNSDFRLRDILPETPATYTFSSGTQGRPKLIMRSHGFTQGLVSLLSENGERDVFPEPDLAIFPGIGVLHLFTGRGTMVVPRSWQGATMRRLHDAAEKLRPATLSANPAFLKQLLKGSGFSSLKHIYIGGASVDVDLLEAAANRWATAKITHIYGCSEAEPIAIVDARLALAKAKAQGDMQVRFLGAPLPQLSCKVSHEGLWVSGPNVCKETLLSDHSPVDAQAVPAAPTIDTGYPWLFTGDRIDCAEDRWYYAGRSSQHAQDFQLEQQVYRSLGHTNAFVWVSAGGQRLLLGEGLRHRRSEILAVYPELTDVLEVKIKRDRRHHSRIDRVATVRPPNPLHRWWILLSERSPLPVLTLIAAGPAFGGILTNREPKTWLIGAISFLFIIFALIVARLMDERKDYQKDCAVNPSRPLPRGLVTVTELSRVLRRLLAGMVALSMGLAYLQATWAAIMGLFATVYLLLMDQDFFWGPKLARSPMVYALVHQLLIVPLYLLPLLAVQTNWSLGPMVVGSFVTANLGSSLCYEIARKLNPKAPAGSATYLQTYGPRLTTQLLCVFGALSLISGWSMRSLNLTWPIFTLYFAAIYIWRRRPSSYRWVESSSALINLAQLWALAFLG